MSTEPEFNAHYECCICKKHLPKEETINIDGNRVCRDNRLCQDTYYTRTIRQDA